MTATGSRLAILGHIDEKPAQGWGPVDWVGRVLQEAKFEEKKVFYIVRVLGFGETP